MPRMAARQMPNVLELTLKCQRAAAVATASGADHLPKEEEER